MYVTAATGVAAIPAPIYGTCFRLRGVPGQMVPALGQYGREGWNAESVPNLSEQILGTYAVGCVLASGHPPTARRLLTVAACQSMCIPTLQLCRGTDAGRGRRG